MKSSLTRRAFLAATTTTIAGSVFAQNKPNTAKVVPGKISPNEKVNIAGIGAGGKGWTDINECARAGGNIVAMADVDWDRAAKTFAEFPDVPKYKDFRNMLEAHPEIDAVTVTTPDLREFRSAVQVAYDQEWNAKYGKDRIERIRAMAK